MARKSNSLSIASIVLAVLAVLFCWLTPLSLMFAATAIGIALLSRGSGHLHGTAVAGIVISAMAAVISAAALILLCAWAVKMLRMYDIGSLANQFIRSIDDPEARQLLESLIGGLL